MNVPTIIRLLKAFILSSVAVATFINGPSLYANAQYWLRDTNTGATDPISGLALINPIRLPISDIEEQPLPNQATLTIEKIKVSVPVVFGVSTDAKTVYDNLVNGVVHFSSTPKPGQGGSSVILCHSSLYPWQYSKFGAPCALLNKLVAGDKITLSYADGRTFNYSMEESLVFDPLTSKDNEELLAFEQSNKPALFVVTCYPTNSNKYRVTVKAVMD